MSLDIQHDEAAHKYSAWIDGEEAVATYRDEGDGTVNFTHTVVPPDLRGQGIGGELVRHALEDTLRRGRRFRASCPFVQRYVERHPQYLKDMAQLHGGERR
ncbi:MAG TPA: GNAT family N-acetyltransferase [Thermoanaerobaculia bacterium]